MMRDVLPQFSKLDASFGHVLLNEGGGKYKRVENRESGFFVRGDIRHLQPVTLGKDQYLLSAINSQSPRLFKNKKITG